ncbi:hypothetical protein BDB00DRAFT_979303, partial [Zychaea mexicana]|uniref:uncharacterized protein n=1 Tax=Zychaea mexicana TaxID=64656 RepID=UPI0022FEEBF4
RKPISSKNPPDTQESICRDPKKQRTDNKPQYTDHSSNDTHPLATVKDNLRGSTLATISEGSSPPSSGLRL